MSGTWASTLLPAIKSAATPRAFSARPVASLKNATSVGMPRSLIATSAVLAVGSTPNTGTPMALKCCSR